MAHGRKGGRKVERTEIDFWTMVRDVLVTSINRGQLPQATTALVFIVLVVRMPRADVSKLVFSVIDGLANWSLVGWFAAGVTIILWYWHVRLQRRWWSPEMSRVSKERTKWQKRALDEKLGSSKR